MLRNEIKEPKTINYFARNKLIISQQNLKLNISELEKSYCNLYNIHLNMKLIDRTNFYIKSLFSKKCKFEDLPVLNINNLTINFNSFKSKTMNANIMRGIYNNRIFFIVKAKHEGEDQVDLHQIFIQRSEYVTDTWLIINQEGNYLRNSYCGPIFSDNSIIKSKSDTLIYNGSITDSIAYNALKNLIQNNMCEQGSLKTFLSESAKDCESIMHE